MAYSWLKTVAADRFDEEFVVAQLSTGLYYSIRGLVVELLDALPFADADAALNAWQQRTGATAEERTQVVAVWQDLLDEGLIADRSDVPGDSAGESQLLIKDRVPSEMSRYGDMQDLLALDIIHDVDDQGWPEEGAIDADADADEEPNEQS